jgi:hypothetical protein
MSAVAPAGGVPLSVQRDEARCEMSPLSFSPCLFLSLFFKLHRHDACRRKLLDEERAAEDDVIKVLTC